MSAERIIGGMFGLQLGSCARPTPAPFLRAKAVLLAYARCGLRVLVERLQSGRIWMPSYLCGVLVDALGALRARVRFYPVNFDLKITDRVWLEEVRPGDLAVLISYFGFPCDKECATLLKESGAWVLEDACQALLSERVGRQSDFVLFSPRKFLGVPDGGILVVQAEVDFGDLVIEPPPAAWWLKTLEAAVLRREFDLHGGERRWFELFRETDTTCPIGAYAMSELSRLLLEQAFDYEVIGRRRRENYRVLLDELGEFAVFQSLPEGVVPLGFPMRHAERDRLRQALFQKQIYPCLHWEIRGYVPESFAESHRLASQIMTLPCDQRYDSEDMRRMAALVRAAKIF